MNKENATTVAFKNEQDYAPDNPEWGKVRLIMRDDTVGGGLNGNLNKPIIDLSKRMAYIKKQNEDITEQAKTGFILLSSFEDGAKLTLSNEVLLFKTDGQYYRWTGDLPKIIEANSTPENSGGVGAGQWVLVGDTAIKTSIANTDDEKLGDAMVGVRLPFNKAVARTQHDKNFDIISIRDFGNVGSYGIDATDVIEIADEWCYKNGKTLYFPAGQYCISRSIEKYARWRGDGAPKLAPFPQLDDDKIYLKNGSQRNLPGSSIILMSSNNLSTVSTSRSDMFSSMTYAIKSAVKYPGSMSGIGIVQDMIVFDENNQLTDPEHDERVECDVGFLIDDSPAGDYNNITVFGYWNKAGICLWSHGTGDNPDYNKFFTSTTMGYYGLAIIGSDVASNHGISGTQFFGVQLFANDHHSRHPQILKNYQSNKYGHVIFIDGNLGLSDSAINGHEFIGGGWRTYSSRPVILGSCSNLHVISVPFEFSRITGQSDTGNQKFIASELTRNIHIAHCRNMTYSIWDHTEFGGKIDRLIITNPFFGDITVGSRGAYIRTTATGGGLDPRIQFTRNCASSESGYAIRMDVSEDDTITTTLNGIAIETTDNATGAKKSKRTQIWNAGSVLVTDGAITINSNNHVINAAENTVLSLINGGQEGDLLYLTKSGQGQVEITTTNNIVAKSNLTLASVYDMLMLVFRNKKWVVLSSTC